MKMTTAGAAFVILAAVFGCNSGPTIYDVTGTVSFDGKPIEQGEIIFLAADNASTPGSGMIQNGVYRPISRAARRRSG